jgi:hypothetical protein
MAAAKLQTAVVLVGTVSVQRDETQKCANKGFVISAMCLLLLQ